MKISDQLRRKIIDTMQENRMRPIDLATATGLQQSTIGRILSTQKTIKDDTAAELSHVLKISLPEMLILSAGGTLKENPPAVFESAGNEYGRADVWADLARWGRSDRVPAKAKQHVLNAAELAGFTSARFSGALSALSTASSPDDDDAEKKPAVA